MTPGKLLSRQLRRHWALPEPDALPALLDGLAALAEREGVDASLVPVLKSMGQFLAQVDESYAQTERDLALSRRSLELSSAELSALNQKLREESAQLQRSASSLRQTLDDLTQGLDLAVGEDLSSVPSEPESPRSDLESIAMHMAQLVRAHQRSREQLHASEQRLLLAVQGSSIGLWDWNLVRDDVHFSTEWAAMLGYEVSDLPPNAAGLIGLLHPDFAIPFGESIGAYFAARRTDTFRQEVRLRCKDGSFKWIEFKGRAVEYDNDGEPLRATGVSLDISARKDYEQAMAHARDAAEAASQAKGDFLANMSHEIRTPMNGILGLTELCLATELDAEQKSYLEMVHTSAKSLLTVINDILDFSKIEANKLDIEHIVFNLPQVVRHALAPLQVRARHQGLALNMHLESDVPEWLTGDPGRLRQVLLNLVGNAIKFTETGSVTVDVRHVPRVGPGSADLRANRLRLSVRDTGIGIEPHRLASVFDAFSQADTSITRRFGGTGLGLTISSRLVSLMGGSLQVKSHPGQGTEFWFELDLPPAQAPVAETTVQPTELPANLHVLVAEDHPINQVVARKVLEHLGAKVTLVDNGTKAVRACVEQRFDLIFLDIQMPELDGFGATRRIRAMELAQGRRTPIVAMTAHAMEGYRERCVAGGMDGYVTKPVDRKQLVQEMLRVLTPASLPQG